MEDKELMLEKLKSIVKQKGLKYSKQREMIFETILDSKKHVSIEDIFTTVHKKYPNAKIGIATIYRALAFLEEVGLISSITIENGTKKYEVSLKEHHDHLICIKCNKIVEFKNDIIEEEQEKVAKQHGFKLVNHTMYLYGICEECQKKEN